MKYLCVCDTCGGREWLRGTAVESDTNAFEMSEDLACGHEHYQVIDEEQDDDWLDI